MAELSRPAARHLQQACQALDEARYRLSCAIVDMPLNPKEADQLTLIQARLAPELENMAASLPKPPQAMP